jgi:nicotinate-nucleotide adenylyltransferase
MKRIGILGGTFNPIHYGHLAVGEVVAEKFKLDQIIFVPAYVPPHKIHYKDIASPHHRLAMVRLAVRGNKKFRVSNIEMKRQDRSYTIDTIRYFQKKFPKNVKFLFVIGSDMLPTLSTWKDVDDLKRMVQFIVVKRKDYDIDHINSKTMFVEEPNLGISASHIRVALKHKRPIRYMTPDSVIEYIRKHKLYSR